MNEWKTVRLGDYITEYSVKNKSNEDIPVYSVTNTQGFCTEYFSKDVSSKDKSNYKIVPRGCFAYNPSRINVGSVDWQRYEDRVIVSPLYNVFKVSPELENQYLYYFLKSDIGHTLITSKAEGSVRDNLKITMLAEFSIPLPPLETQKLIAAQLDKCTALIAKHKQMLEKYDTLIKSRFIEMFGDNPIENGKWKVETLGSHLITIDNGKSFVCSDSMRKGEYPAILKLSAVTYGEYNQNENKALLDEDMFLKKVEVKQGDLLFTRKNTPELVGMAAYVFETERNLMMPDLIFRLNVKDDLNKIYLWKLINHPVFRERIQNLANGSAKSMSNISKERLQALKIPVPPLSLQNNFATFVQQIDKSKFAVQKSLEKAETLYKSLMQRYFA